MKRIALVLALLTVACGGGDKKKPTTTTVPSTTTTAPPTTALGLIPPGGGPLTGLPVDPARANRPLLIVKIDNAPKARPQAGLNQADVVVEEAVEGGVTRFATFFHSQDADPVGPVRSARTTDMLIAAPLNRPLFAYSGANAKVEGVIRQSPVVNIGHGAASSDYYRQRGRPGPYDLFGNTSRMFARTPAGAGPPPPLLAFRHPGQPSVGDPAAGVSMEYRGRIVTSVQWQWEPAWNAWKRSQDGGAHVDAAGVQVTAQNVVVQMVTYHDTGDRDQSGYAVPEANLIGEGEAWVLSDGKVVKGRWRRTAPGEVTQYLDASGAHIRLTPGRTWIELPIPNAARLS